jgi:ribosome biogenesis GTPase
VTKIQEERLQRAERKASRNGPALADGDLGPEQTGLLIASFGPTVEVESDTGASYRCALRQNLGLPVVGDRVVWQAAGGTGVVTAITPRRSVLARPDASGEPKPLAANIDQILIVAAPVPRYDIDLIDQYLVAAECTGITPVIVLNKVDLLSGEERTQTDREFSPYAAIGYTLLHASTRANHGLDELVTELRDRTSVFVGQSGVGKSSLVQALMPDEQVRVGALTEGTGLGRHTTSSARLYHLPTGGAVIDSPGVREYQLWDLRRDALAQGFIEFRPLLGQCRFRDCRHESEPGCALSAAASSGEISARRLESFRRIAAEVESRHKPEWQKG